MSKIDWRLYNNEELLLENIGATATFSNEFIIYEDAFGKHTIDRKEQFYERVVEDSTMSIFFKKKILLIQFDGQTYTFDIDCSYKDNDKGIILEYTLGEDKKVIKIKGVE